MSSPSAAVEHPGAARVRAVRRARAGHEVVEVDNGLIRLVLAPALGGRILSAVRDGREFLHRDPALLDDALNVRDLRAVGPHDGPMSAWRNWGGDKTWPAPQGWSGPGEWAGPPDPVLDSGAYACAVDVADDGSRADITLTSGDDPRTGLRLTRRITLAAGRCDFALRLTARNVSAKNVRWALWNVTQLPGRPVRRPGDGVWLGTAGSGAPDTVDLVAGTGRPRVERHGDVLHVPAQDVVGKVGFPDAAGWIAHVGPAGTWTYRFPVDPTAAYPDGGSRVEVWMEHPLPAPLVHLGGLRPSHRVVECEALGPCRELAPGESARLDGTMSLGPRLGAVTSVGRHAWWSAPLAFAEGTVTGMCVPSGSGDASLLLLDAAGRVLWRRELGVCAAGVPLALDAAVPAASGTVRLEVRRGQDVLGSVAVAAP
ncbi:hypothetical protein GCM10010294_69840 [Streptomyces griseoloalbus]|uniref:DUF4380 domain-containing protein n=1 Tax=Streptomyces griseoloalbus TaxID=67303 RepID=UPI0019878375|nr:hypothetical protein GCM10010294_69840 [Streptomyces griseoloalbus]